MYKVLKVELIYVRVYTYINTSTYQQVRSILNTGTDIRHIVGLLSAHGLRFDSHKISHLPISVIATLPPPKHLLSSPSTLPLALRSLTPFLIHRHPPNSPLPILLSLRNFRNRNFRRRSGSLSISCASLCGARLDNHDRDGRAAEDEVLLRAFISSFLSSSFLC